MKKCLAIFLLFFSLNAITQTRTGTGPNDDYWGEDSVGVTWLLDALNNNVRSCKIGLERFNTILDLTKTISRLRALKYLEDLNKNGFSSECPFPGNIPSEIQCLFDKNSKEALHDLLHQPKVVGKELRRYKLSQELNKHSNAHKLDRIEVELAV